jgi:uncharacterized protein (TIGR02246 family)
VPASSAEDRAQTLLASLQAAVRDKDAAATLAHFTHDATLVGTAAANLDRPAIEGYVETVFAQSGYVHWEWDMVTVVDERPGAFTFLALGTVGLDDGSPDAPRDAFRLTCLAVDETDAWRIRVFHGSVPQA